MARSVRKLHGVTPRETLDRAAFVLAFLFGVLGGLLLKSLGAHPFVTAGYAAFILVLYAIAAWAGGRIKIEPETIGDNCYYLGFLFTLSSLAFTLYQMSDPSATDGKAVEIPTVISGFGVALSSTIVGVFLRVFMMQLRPDFVAKDREVRADINRSYGEFKKNMSGILAQMKAFSTESIQMAAERDERLAQSTEDFVKDHQDALVQSADKLAKNMEAAMTDASQKSMAAMTEVARKTATDASKVISSLTEEIEKLRTEIARHETLASQEVAVRHTKMKVELDASAEQLRTHVSSMAGYVEAVDLVSEAMTKTLKPAIDLAAATLAKQDVAFSAADPVAEPPNTVESGSARDTPVRRWTLGGKNS